MSSQYLVQLIDSIVVKLLDPDYRSIQHEITSMIEKNNAALGLAAEGFLFRGSYYTNLDPKLQSKGQRTTLHIRLVPEFMGTIKRRADFDYDRQQIRQVLVLLVQGAKSEQDVRDTLPECLADLLPFPPLARTRPEAFTIVGDERAMRQYLKVRDKIMYYSALRLIV